MPIIIPNDLLPETYKLFPIPDQRFEDQSISNDNKYVAYIDCFWMAVWNIKTRECLWKLDSMDYRSENNYCVEITPDSKYVVSAGCNITFRDLQTGEIIWSKEHPYGTAIALKISSDGKDIVSACTTISIHDLSSGKLTKTIFMSEDGEDYTVDFSGVAISRNKAYIAANLGMGATVVWNRSGDIVYVLRDYDDNLDMSYIGIDLEFSPDDNYLASFRPDQKSIDIWEMKTGTLINTLKHDNEMWGIKFIPKKSSLVVKTTTGNIIWDYLEESNEFRYSKDMSLISQTELSSEVMKLKKDKIIISIKDFIDRQIRYFYKNPSKKLIRKLEKKLPDAVKGWPEKYIPFVIEEYKRAINFYGELQPSKWKKWSKSLLNLITYIRL